MFGHGGLDGLNALLGFYLLVGAIACGLLGGVLAVAHRRRRRMGRVDLGAFLLSLPAALALPATFVFLVFEETFLFALPPFALAVAWICFFVRRRFARLVVGLVAAGVLLLCGLRSQGLIQTNGPLDAAISNRVETWICRLMGWPCGEGR